MPTHAVPEKAGRCLTPALGAPLAAPAVAEATALEEEEESTPLEVEGVRVGVGVEAGDDTDDETSVEVSAGSEEPSPVGEGEDSVGVGSMELVLLVNTPPVISVPLIGIGAVMRVDVDGPSPVDPTVTPPLIVNLALALSDPSIRLWINKRSRLVHT